MNITHKIKLDMQENSKRQTIFVKQGDSMSRCVEITLYNSGTAWTVPSGETILQIAYYKPDYTGGVYDTMPDNTVACTYSENVVTAHLHPQMFTVSGIVACELRFLNNNGAQLSTFSWFMSVAESATNKINSEDYFNFACLKELRMDIGELSDLETNAKESLVTAINECYSKRIAPVSAHSGNGFSYAASGEQLPTVVPGSAGEHVGKGVQIVFIPDMTNTEPECTLQINGGSAVPIRRRAKTGTQSANGIDATLPMKAGALSRGVPYTMTFCGLYWLLDSYVPLDGGGGGIDPQELAQAVEDALTDAVKNGEVAPAAHEHSYSDLKNTPVIPTIPDSLPANGGNADTVGGMTVDAIKDDANAFLVAELAKRGQLKPEFANSVEECVDESKLYVLPDGYIWAYMYGGASGPSYTNLAGNVLTDTRLSTSGGSKSCTGAVTTGFIPCKAGQVIRMQGFDPTVLIDGSTNPYICFYTAAAESAIVSDTTYTRPNLLYGSPGGITKEGDVYYYTAFTCGSGGTDVKPHPLQDSITHIRICGKAIEGAEIIVTVDQEITEGTGTGYAWRNTGHAFVPADYEERIVALENKVPENHEGRFAALEKPWKGLKWVCLGDSLTYTNERATKRYFDYIAEKTGIAVVNMGDGGTGYMRTREEGRAFFQRIVNAPADTDIVTIFGSGNDCGHTFDDYGLGSITDTGTDTICGCINTTIDTIQERMPMVRLGIITPTPWEKWPPYDGENKMAQYSRAIVEICKARSIPCLDLYHCSNLRPWDEDFRALAYSRDDGSGVHPDENGHAMIAPRIKAFLDTLIL